MFIRKPKGKQTVQFYEKKLVVHLETEALEIKYRPLMYFALK